LLKHVLFGYNKSSYSEFTPKLVKNSYYGTFIGGFKPGMALLEWIFFENLNEKSIKTHVKNLKWNLAQINN